VSRPANFDRLAGIYCWMEYLSFGPMLMLSRLQFMAQMKNARHALILGDGDGRFTRRLLEANSQVQVSAVDASPAMLRTLLHSAGSHATRVQTLCADLRGWQPQGTNYDLVVTHFLLDCLSTEEVDELVKSILPALGEDAYWVVSEFAIPESWFAHRFALLLVGFLYFAFGILTGLKIRRLPRYAASLSAAGFELRSQSTRLFGVLRSELWQRFNPL